MNMGHFSRSMAGNHSLAESIEVCGATRVHGARREIAPYRKHPLFRINVIAAFCMLMAVIFLLLFSGCDSPHKSPVDAGNGLLGSDTVEAVALSVTPSGKGYWILSKSGSGKPANGGIFPFGDAVYYGHGVGGDDGVVGMARTPTGKGYWILTKNGGIIPMVMRLQGDGRAGMTMVAMAATPSGQLLDPFQERRHPYVWRCAL